VSERFLRRAILAFLALFALWVAYDYMQLAFFSATAERPVASRGDLASMERTAIEVFDAVSPSVVFVTTVEQFGLDLSGHSVGELGMGSGFVWDAAGHIVTNDHVVRGADLIGVRFRGEDTGPAVVVGRAPEYDLAVLRMRGQHRTYRPVPIGSSKNLLVGQAVFAIGNPYGLAGTLTHGLVSALHRRLPSAAGREIRGLIQTDAAINPGNSGGPLLDSAGRLIGVNTAIASNTGAFAGVGFAVPVDLVNRVVATLIREGRVPRPGIGITALGEDVAARLGVDGVVVAGVLPGTPAAAAGLVGLDAVRGRLGDVITHAQGKRVRSVADLAAVLDEVGMGNRAVLRAERNGKSRAVEVEVMDITEGEEDAR
jgi:2-alkenal reductase